MDEYAKLLTSVATFVGAIAWPTTILIIVAFFRTELRSILTGMPPLIARVKSATVAGIALELDRVADAETGNEVNKSGKITPRQVEAAARIQTQEVGSQTLLRELDRLCLEYDSLRRTLPSGDERTRAMTRIIVKMRSLAPSLIEYLHIYKGSGSPGSRLAAIAMMQMIPRVADLDWLKGRFSSEQPFLFYHAALALQNVANISDTADKRKQLRDVAEQALATVKSFAGPPDRGTIEVLDMLLSGLPRS